MNGTIPALLGIVPAHDALQMRAYSRKAMDLAIIILVHGQRFAGLGIQDASIADGETLNVGDVALEEAFVLRVDLEVVRDHAGDARERRDAFGVVHFAPRVVDALDFVGDELAC